MTIKKNGICDNLLQLKRFVSDDIPFKHLTIIDKIYLNNIRSMYIKKHTWMLVLITQFQYGQTIEKSYKNYGLITNVKSFEEIVPKPSNLNQWLGFDKIDQFYDNPDVKKIKRKKLEFNTDSFLTKSSAYDTDGLSFEKYEYDDNHRLIYKVYWIGTHLDSLQDLTHTNYTYKDSLVYIKTLDNDGSTLEEIYLLEKGKFVKCIHPINKAVISKYTYDDNGYCVGITTNFDSGSIHWTITPFYDEQGVLIREVDKNSNYNLTRTSEFLSNGLLSREINDNGVDVDTYTYDYQYDSHGNWIYKIDYTDGEPNAVWKRVYEYW